MVGVGIVGVCKVTYDKVGSVKVQSTNSSRWCRYAVGLGCGSSQIIIADGVGEQVKCT